MLRPFTALIILAALLPAIGKTSLQIIVLQPIYIYIYLSKNLSSCIQNVLFIRLSLLILVYSSNEDPSKKMNIECYNCIGEDHECEPGILGEKVKCKPGVKHCVKTWTGK